MRLSAANIRGNLEVLYPLYREWMYKVQHYQCCASQTDIATFLDFIEWIYDHPLEIKGEE